MPTRKLRPVKSPKNRTVFDQSSDEPLFSGAGDLDYVCPVCSNPIAVKIRPNTFFNIAVQCYKCKTLSAFDDLPKGAVLQGACVVADAKRYRLSGPIFIDKPNPVPVIGAGPDGELPDLKKAQPTPLPS